MTWTGTLNARRAALGQQGSMCQDRRGQVRWPEGSAAAASLACFLGLKIDWAYAPGQVKILTSSDGSSFEEAKCWASSSRSEVAYEETFMFDSVRNVKAATIVMRSLLRHASAVLPCLRWTLSRPGFRGAPNLGDILASTQQLWLHSQALSC